MAARFTQTSQTPTVFELLEVLHDLVEWELVAVHLRGMTNAEIHKIKKQLSGQDTEQQKLSVFSKWLSMCPDASWDDVVTALEKGNELKLAERVREGKLVNNETIPVPSTRSAPTIGQLIKQVKPESHNWFKIGTFLDVPEWKLAAIESQKSDCTDRLILVFEYWKKNAKEHTNPFTWETIIEILRDIDNNALADEIKKEFVG